MGNGCPRLVQRLPNAWATVAHGLGNGCPRLGQWLPNAWAIVAQGLCNSCPMLGQWLPKAWATVPQYLGNGCRKLGKWFPNQSLRNGSQFQCLGSAVPVMGSSSFPARPLGVQFRRSPLLRRRMFGSGRPAHSLAQLSPTGSTQPSHRLMHPPSLPVADQPSQSFKSDPGVITGFGIGSRPPVRRRSHGAQKSRGLYTLRRRDHEGYHDGAALSGLGRPPSSPREAVCETNM